MNEPVLYVVGDYYGAHGPFVSLFDVWKMVTPANINSLKDIKKGDIILFGGGEDISPSIYNEVCHPRTHAVEKYSNRDIFEVGIFEEYKGVAKFLGICRGAQLLCALSGGKLVQHVNNHAGQWHDIRTNTNDKYYVSSAHHQMQWPWKVPHTILAWAEEPLSDVYVGTIEDEELYFPKAAYRSITKGEQPRLIEPEVVFYPQTDSLAIQYHPEFMSFSALGVQYAKKLVKEYLIGN